MRKSRKYDIKNLEELHAMVCQLKAEHTLQGEMLVKDVKIYLHQFTPGAVIKKYAAPSALLKVDEKYNISSTIMSWVLPLLMNSTLFRGSGILTKAVVGLASGKVGKALDAEHLSAIFNSVKSWFTGAKKKKVKTEAVVDYGIPPDSESY